MPLLKQWVHTSLITSFYPLDLPARLISILVPSYFQSPLSTCPPILFSVFVCLGLQPHGCSPTRQLPPPRPSSSLRDIQEMSWLSFHSVTATVFVCCIKLGSDESIGFFNTGVPSFWSFIVCHCYWRIIDKFRIMNQWFVRAPSTVCVPFELFCSFWLRLKISHSYLCWW